MTKWNSVDDVIDFIEANAPREEGERFPVCKAPYELVNGAVQELKARGRFTNLEAYDIRGTMNLWISEEGTNWELARKATKTLLQKLQLEQPNKTPIELLTEITIEAFRKQSINRYGTRLAGMMQMIHEGSPYSALKDLIDNDDEYKEYRDFQPYDMKDSPKETWKNNDGNINYKLARQATKALVQKLQQKQPDKTLTQILTEITIITFKTQSINKYGTTLKGMMTVVHNCSPYSALKNLIDNDDEYKEYRDFQPYDMKTSPANTWNKKNGSKNYELARQATKTLIQKLHQEQPGKDLAQILSQINRDAFCHQSINKYQTTLCGMLDNVYGSSPYLALKDLFENDAEYKQYLPLLEQRKRMAA